MRICGIFLLALSIAYGGIRAAGRLKKKTRDTEALIAFIDWLSRSIPSRGCPLPQLYAVYTDERIAPFLLRLRTRGSLSETVREDAALLAADGGTISGLLHFALSLETCRTREEGAALCLSFRKELEEYLEQHRTADAVKKELYEKLGVICAAAFVIAVY